MNIRIMVVDDETPIREWIEYCLSDVGDGIEVVCTAQNGRDAYELFLQFRPSLVITDIKMPVMDGLELIRRIKVEASDTSFIILTCHEDFAYAREAIKLGAEDYLLKTEVTKERLADVVKKVAAKSKDMAINEAVYIKRQMYLRAIADGVVTDISAEKLLKSGMPPLNGNYFAAAIVNKSGNESVSIISEYETQITCVSYDNNIIILIVKSERTPSTLLQINNIMKFAEAMKNSFGGTVGISKVYDDVSQLGAAMHGALEQLAQGFYKGAGSVNIEMLATKSHVDIDLQAETEELLRRVNILTSEQLATDVLSLFDRICKSKFKDTKQVIASFERIVNRICEKNDALKENRPNLCEADDAEQLQNMLREILECSSDRISHSGKYIDEAIQYMNEHYSDECTLINVAAEVGLNPEYFSRLFKNETGCNFNNYLTGIRIKAAKQLLMDKELRIGDIAEMVGYQNIAYFSKIFKKYEGITPFEYRR